MPAKEQQDRTLSEYVVREAVEKGMDTPLREVIVEAVEEAEGGSSGGRTLPLAGALVGLGAAAGYLLGSRETELESGDISLESVEEPEIIDEVTGDEDSSDEMGGDVESETADGSSGSWLRRILIGVGIVAAVAFARRRMQSSEEDEWEPIEEFETAVSDEDEGEEEAEAEGEEEEAEAESEDEEEAEAEQDEEEEEEE